MKTTIYVETQETAETQQLVQTAIESEIARLELALAAAHKRLAPFEKKYGVTSNQFMTEWAAEALDGGDDEYVQWAGEYQLKERLKQKLERLRGIEYGDSGVLHAG